MKLEASRGFPLIRNTPPQAHRSSQARAVVLSCMALMASAGLAAAILLGAGSLLAASCGLAALTILLACRSSQQPVRVEIESPEVLALGGFPSASLAARGYAARSCQDAQEAFRWKLRLAIRAQKEIILSGNYVGGCAFDVMLNIIERKLEAVPDFRACILGSKHFVTREQFERMKGWREKFGTRFLWVKTEKYLHRQEGLPDREANNHTKGLVIDGGKAFVLGGSGLEDKYAFSDGLSRDSGSKAGGLVGLVIARNFRDMDWVFARPLLKQTPENRTIIEHDAGSQLRHELLKLAAIYQRVNAEQDGTDELTDVAAQFPMPPNEVLYPSRWEHLLLSTGCELDLWAQGPTDSQSKFSERLTREISAARKRIVIHHMFFNPSPQVMEALKEALNRGCSVVITHNFDNGGKDSPAAHAAFVPASRARLAELASGINPEAQERLQCYEFGGVGSKTSVPRKATLHKKVIVIDGETVIGGSSNLGHKSCLESTDYEVNFVAKSRQLAKATENKLAPDRFVTTKMRHKSGLKAHAVVRDPLVSRSWMERLKAWIFLRFLARHCN